MPKRAGIAIITLGAVLLLSALLLFLYNGYEERRAEQNAELLLNDIKNAISLNSKVPLPSQSPSGQPSEQTFASDDSSATNYVPSQVQSLPTEEPVAQATNEGYSTQHTNEALNTDEPYDEPFDEPYDAPYEDPYDAPYEDPYDDLYDEPHDDEYEWQQPSRAERPTRPAQQASSRPTTEKKEEPQTVQPTTAASRIDGDMTVVTIYGYDYIGYLSIPDLYLELPVMSEWDYRKLEYAPCRHFGSTTKDNLVIAAHNYRSQFAHLPYLQAGAKVFFTDMNGTVIEYSLQRIEQLQADAVETVLNSEHDLVLYTCTTSGTYRIAAFFDRTV